MVRRMKVYSTAQEATATDGGEPIGSLPLKQLIRDLVIWDRKDNPNASDPKLSRQHMMTHFPKYPDCPICNQCRTRREDACRMRVDQEDVSHDWIEPKKFGDLITADHKIIGEKTSTTSRRTTIG